MIWDGSFGSTDLRKCHPSVLVCGISNFEPEVDMASKEKRK